jgi:hypothetical protein
MNNHLRLVSFIGVILLGVHFLAFAGVNQSTGIEEVCTYQDQLFTYELRDERGSGVKVEQKLENFYITATSNDGGLTWNTVNEAGSFEQFDVIDTWNCSAFKNPLIDTDHPSIEYRHVPGNAIERSKDRGRSWQVIYELSELDQEVRKHYQLRTIGSAPSVMTGKLLPISTLIDHRTGNVIFAMGHSGVLVLTPDDQWHWASVGNYRLEEITLERALGAIYWEFWMAVALAALIIICGWFYVQDYVGDFRVFWGIIVGWLYWLLFVLVFLPNHHFNYYLLIDGSPILPGSFALLVIPLLIIALKNLIVEFRYYFLPIFPLAFGTGVCFLYPYYQWGLGDISKYGTAQLESTAVTVLIIVIGYIYLTRYIDFKKKVERDKSPFYEENEA